MLEDKQTRLMTILAVVLVGLIVAIRFIEPPDGDSDEPEQPELSELVDVAVTDVAVLTLVTAEGTLVAEQSTTGWTIVEPFRGPGDAQALDDLILLLDRLQAQPPMENADPVSYGLDTPVATLILRDHDGIETRLDVGTDSPIGFKSYIQYNQGGIQIASSQPGATLARPLELYRDRSIVNVPASALSSISWTHGEDSWTVVQTDGRWWLPDGTKASDAAVEGAIAGLAAMRFEAFFPDLSHEEAGLAPPVGQLRLESDTVTTINVGTERMGGVLVQAPNGTVGTVASLAPLMLTPDRLVESRVVAISPAGLESLQVELDGTTATWTRDELGAWSRNGAPDPFQGQGPFQMVTAITADRTTPVPELGEQTGRIEAVSGLDVVTIVLGQEIEGGRVAQDQGGGPAFLIPDPEVSEMRSLL